jgi:threonine synthase
MGDFYAVTDEEILDAYRLLASEEGISANQPALLPLPACCK